MSSSAPHPRSKAPSAGVPPVIGRALYPWADLVIDGATTKRQAYLPEALPEVWAHYRGEDGVESRVYRVTDAPGLAADRVTIVLVLQYPPHQHTHSDRSAQSAASGPAGAGAQAGVSPGAGVRVAFVAEQSASTSWLNHQALDGTFGDSAPYTPTTAMSVRGSHRAVALHDDRSQARTAERAEHAARTWSLYEWLTTGPVADEAPTWTMPKAKVWLKWFRGGISDPQTRAAFEALGVRPSGNDVRGRQVTTPAAVGELLAEPMSVDQALAWVPLIGSDPRPALLAHAAGLSAEQVAPYVGTRLDPFDARTIFESHIAARIAEIKRSVDDGWSTRGRAAIDASAPDGCTSEAWANLWTEFMPASIASAYAAAGLTYGEAVRAHLSGKTPSGEVLQMLAGLRDQP